MPPANQTPQTAIVFTKTPHSQIDQPFVNTYRGLNTITMNAETAAPVAPTHPVGVVRVKSEYVLHVPREAPSRVAPETTGEQASVPAPAEGSTVVPGTRARGQNKAGAREHHKFEGSGAKPTFEGETNFLVGDVLTKVKCVLRPVWHKRQREGEPLDDSFARAIAEGISAATAADKRAAAAAAAAAAATASTSEAAASAVSEAVPPAEPAAAVVAPVEVAAEVPVVAPVAALPPATESNETKVVEPAAATEAEDPELVALRAKRKDELSGIVMPERTTEDQKRDNAAKRDGLFRNKLVLAPLTTVGNLPYRRICAEYGADTTLSEMALIYNLNKTQKSEWSLLRRHESEGLFGIQVAVSRPHDAREFARAIEASGFSYDFIDINCGCPVDMIVKSGCGCGLWERKGKLKEVVQNLVNFQSKPVTIKCRIGPDENDPQLHKHIGEYEEWGASAVTIHGRSRKQRYTRLANWSYVEQCSHLTNLPVIGNGDVTCYGDVQSHQQTAPNVSSYMLGRGALIKPWAFKEIKDKTAYDPSSSERYEMMAKFCKYGLAHWGADEKGVQTTRRFLLEWLSFLHRYVPTGLVEPGFPQRINERPPAYRGRDELETLMASEHVDDWIKISEMLLGPCGDKFRFTPKHKSSSYSTTTTGAPLTAAELDKAGVDEG